MATCADHVQFSVYHLFMQMGHQNHKQADHDPDAAPCINLIFAHTRSGWESWNRNCSCAEQAMQESATWRPVELDAPDISRRAV